MKEQILQLREQGKSYAEICNTLGCSKGTVSYHCGAGQKSKTKTRAQKNRAGMVLSRKIWRFKNREQFSSDVRKAVRCKADDFQRREGYCLGKRKIVFTYDDVVAKFGMRSECYLTGRPIDLTQPKTYTFDHIVPAARGGSNDMSNLGLCCKDANSAKADMTQDEFLILCKEVLAHHGYTISA